MNTLILSRKIIQAVGGFTLICQGWLPMKFIVQGKTKKQALYICKKIQLLYLNKAACIFFPNPAATISTKANTAMQYTPFTGIQQESNANSKPNKGGEQLPKNPAQRPIPFSPTEQNSNKFKNRLLEHFAKTAFKDNGKFPPPTSTSKKEQFPKPNITLFPWLFTSKNH